MSLESIYNYETGETNLVKDERYKNVGSDTFQLGTIKRAFIEVDFAIQLNDSNGTELEEGVDFEFTNKDTEYTSLEGVDVWTGITILNAFYETGVLYITYRALGSYTDGDFIRDMRDDVDEAQADIVALETNPALPTNYITGLLISNDTDTEHDINITAGRCKDSTGAIDLILTSEITKQIDAAWAVGDDDGGLDTGSVAADTWYYIWLIRKDSDSTIDALFSLSKTAPTMPAGYTYFGRVRGAVLTDGSANILQFHQSDDHFFFNDRIYDLNTGTAGTTRQLLTVGVPPNFIGICQMRVIDGDVSYIWFDSVLKTDVAADTDTCDIRVPSSSSVNKPIKVDASSQIAYRSSRSGISLDISTTGFIDPARS